MDERKLAALCAGLGAALALLMASYDRPAPPPESQSPAAQGAEIRNVPPGRPIPVAPAPKTILVMAGAQGD